MALDQNGELTLSAQVRADLVLRITSGRYAVGEKIPSLRALAAEYEVAELTVHSAVKQLQFEGVLASATGRGTFVRTMPTAQRQPDTSLADVVAEMSVELAELRQRVAVLEARST